MAEDNAELGAALNRLIPKTLDTIIMLNRDCAEIRIATAGDLKPLRARIPTNDFAVSMADWAFVALDWHPPSQPRQMIITLIGHNLDKMTGWYTSDVCQFDEQTGCVRTRNSLYRVSGPRTNKPDLLRLCSWVHAAGVGKQLGVLPIYY